MFPRRFVMVAVVGLVVFALLGAWSGSVQRDAWLQGYLVGQAAGGEGAKAAPLAPFLYGGYGPFGGPRFGSNPFGFLFPLLFFGLVIFGLSRLGRFMAWQRWAAQGGPGGPQGPQGPGSEGQAPQFGQPYGPWGWHGRHGHRPPWWAQPPQSGQQPQSGDAPTQPPTPRGWGEQPPQREAEASGGEPRHVAYL